ncbi:MAG: PorT family protein [Ignavibacteriae bacterium]|nr:PorT family protein [Ignavibacteriota bacterium]MCB9216921.1 PorT family protein [Ignavibacteria bacterium]
MKLLLCLTTLILSGVISTTFTWEVIAQEIAPPIANDTISSTATDTLLVADTMQPQLRMGVFSGISFSSAHVEDIPVVPQTKSGFHGGIRTEMEFAYPIYFLFEIEYAQRGINSENVTTGGATFQESFQFNYLNFPILFRLGIPITSSFEVSAGFGAVPSALLTRTQSIRFEDSDTSMNVSEGLEEFDFGLEYRFGLEYHLSSYHSLTFDGRYLHGLQNLLILSPTEQDDRIWKNRSLSFSLGIMYQLQRSVR